MVTTLILAGLMLAPVAPAKRTPARAAVKTAVHAPEVLPFIADDYPKAVALAKARKVPLFIEAWAPW